MMYDLRNSLIVSGIIGVLIGVACVALTGALPKKWRPKFGRAAAVCLGFGLVCLWFALWLPPPGPGYLGHAY